MSTPASPSVPPPTPSSPTAPPAAKRRTGLYLAVAVAVIVVVLLVAFAALPALTPSGSGKGAPVLTYRGAVSIANGSAGGYAGGGWTLLFAAGLVSATNETFALNQALLGNLSAYCTYTPVASEHNLTVPAFVGNRSSGQAPAWAFAYRNDTDAVALVTVVDGQGTVFATLTGLECGIGAAFLNPVPAGAIDSSAAAAAAFPEAAGFLAAHPNASAELGLFGPLRTENGTLPAEWSLLYTTCTLNPSAGGSGDLFNATVNALTGHLLGWKLTTGIPCRTSMTAVSGASSPLAPLSGPAAAGPRELGAS
ncbi:MAG TPA: hypothetical protein VEH28_07940 [Thermoplasmata archaeon]|nr:hypothetical protein [Thermoplasmata archaeon]